jgi:hypothetical protein
MTLEGVVKINNGGRGLKKIKKWWHHVSTKLFQ